MHALLTQTETTCTVSNVYVYDTITHATHFRPTLSSEDSHLQAFIYKVKHINSDTELKIQVKRHNKKVKTMKHKKL